LDIGFAQLDRMTTDPGPSPSMTASARSAFDITPRRVSIGGASRAELRARLAGAGIKLNALTAEEIFDDARNDTLAFVRAQNEG